MLVLLQSEAAQALEVKCASPTQPGKLQARSPQAAFSKDHGSRLGTRTVRIGSAKLGGKPGILITAIDQRQKIVSLFCHGSTATDCLVRTTQSKEEPTTWVRGSLTKTPIAAGQFAYTIEKAEAGALLMILFGPNINDYLRKAPAATSDLLQ
jgi:hypothetical protein